MKQKRKVKSLISSTDGRSLWLTLLLFLLGGILCFGAVSLFTSSVGVHAAEDPESRINYPGVEDKHEVLLKFGLIPEGGVNPVNEMYLTGKAFFVSGTAISVNNSVAQIQVGKYINYLLGENRGSNWIDISSDNVTLIGGSNVKVSENNDNTAILGGIDNEISIGNSNEKAAPVMLGGEGNKITVSQEGSAIVGGQGNKISGEGSYDFILGGNANVVTGSNVIVGGARVNVNNKSDLFAFSYGDAGIEFAPEKGNTFYLNLKHGLGLNEAAANTGVHSKGAVSFGEVDIVSVSCTTADEGVQGVWEGCLVGCTYESATGTPSGRWEMIDHGTGCAKKCTDNSNDCMINPIDPEGKTPYTAYCTTDGVDTGHAFHCGGEDDILPRYNNVIFETVLIDSNIPCPQPGAANWTENRCVFKCEGGYHLRVDETVTNGDGRMRCYKDCELPWPGAEPLKHNETVTAYKRENVYCSNDAGTAPIRDSCKNYKATLVCQNGTLYVANGDGKTASANTASSQGYEFSGCMLHQYRCPTTTYNYEKSQITNYFSDTVSNWNISDRGTLNGQRGKYKLCVDYDTQGNKIQYQNGEQCDALNKEGNSYSKHYQWLGCQNNYHTGSWDGGHVCRADCSLINRSTNRTEYFLHQTTRTACKTKSESCENGAGKCECTTLVCDDGKWKKNGTVTNEYKYTDCVLNNYNCSTTNYNVTEAEKTSHQPESIYGLSCDSYKGESDKVTCTKTKTDYKLTDCLDWDRETGFHTEDNKFCISNYDERDCTTAGAPASLTNHWHYIAGQVPVYWNGTAYNVGSWATPDNCAWECYPNTSYHLENGDCKSNTRGVDCDDYYADDLPDNAHWREQGVQLWNGTWNNGRWLDPARNSCDWECNDGYHANGNSCELNCDVNSCEGYNLTTCPANGHCTPCTTVNSSCQEGAKKWKLDYCDDDYEVSGDECVYNPSCTPNTCSAFGLSSCPANGNCSYCTPVDASCNYGTQKAQLNSCKCGYYKNGNSCNACGVGEYSSAGATSCNSCTNKPDNAHYTSNACSNSCNWACDPGYTKSGNICIEDEPDPISCNCGYYDNNGTCTACGAKKYSSAGATSCTTASIGYYANSSCSQTACTNKPDNAHYTSNASTNSCSWECEEGYTKSGDTCVADPSCTPTTCSSSYNQTTCPSGKGCSSCTATNSDCSTTTKYKVDCTLNECSGYGYTTCPAGKTCDSCNAVDSSCNTTTKYKVTGNSCTPTTCSSSYNQTTCPSGKGCSSCTATNSDCSTTTKYKVDCTLNECSGYGYTTCPAGKTCDSCNAVDSSCNTTTKYKVTGNICTPSKTCASYDLSSSPSGSCYNTYTKSDGCTNSLTCYENGCDGMKDTCYYPDSTMPSDFASNPNFDITDFEHGICATNNCFPAGTKITMADGTLKNIEDVITGDIVLSYNEKTQKLEPNMVLSPIVHENVDDEMYELMINGNILKVTGAHRFYVVNSYESEYQCTMGYEWIAAKNLKAGDMLFMKDGSHPIIESISHYAIHETVYNLSVENSHTYFVNEGYLVHNSKTEITTCTPTTCSSSYSYSSCPSGKGCSSCTATNSDCTETTKYKVDCTLNSCSSSYSYSSCPSGKGCSSCTSVDSSCNSTTKYKVDCTLNSCSSEYSYGSCPSGKTCDSCTSVDSSCTSTTKYKVTGNSCTPTTCSSDYSYNSCPSGKICDSCTATNSDCTETTKYKVTGECKTDETKPEGCYKENIGDDGCGGTYKYYTAMSTSCGAAYLWDASQCKCVSCSTLYPKSEGWYTSKPSGCWTAGEQVNCHGPVWTHYTNQADSCNGSFDSSTCTCTECTGEGYSMYITSVDNCRYLTNPSITCKWGNQCCKCVGGGSTSVPTCSDHAGCYSSYDECRNADNLAADGRICVSCNYGGMSCRCLTYAGCPS